MRKNENGQVGQNVCIYEYTYVYICIFKEVTGSQVPPYIWHFIIKISNAQNLKELYSERSYTAT